AARRTGGRSGLARIKLGGIPRCSARFCESGRLRKAKSEVAGDRVAAKASDAVRFIPHRPQDAPPAGGQGTRECREFEAPGHPCIAVNIKKTNVLLIFRRGLLSASPWSSISACPVLSLMPGGLESEADAFPALNTLWTFNSFDSDCSS